MLQPQPDPKARWIAHLIVGAVAAYAIGKRVGPAGTLVTAALSMGIHEALDAPVAKALSEAGI
jgi:hypothetical protein